MNLLYNSLLYNQYLATVTKLQQLIIDIIIRIINTMLIIFFEQFNPGIGRKHNKKNS